MNGFIASTLEHGPRLALTCGACKHTHTFSTDERAGVFANDPSSEATAGWLRVLLERGYVLGAAQAAGWTVEIEHPHGPAPIITFALCPGCVAMQGTA